MEQKYETLINACLEQLDEIDEVDEENASSCKTVTFLKTIINFSSPKATASKKIQIIKHVFNCAEPQNLGELFVCDSFLLKKSEPLVWSVFSDSIELVKFFLPFTTSNEEKESALFFALVQNKMEILEFLLAHGINLNDANEQNLSFEKLKLLACLKKKCERVVT